MWISFLGVGLAARRRAHISIDAFVNALHGRPRKVADFISDLIVFVFWLYVGASGFDMFLQNHDQKSPALMLRMDLVYLAIPIGCLLLALIVLQLNFGKKPDIDDSSGNGGHY